LMLGSMRSRPRAAETATCRCGSIPTRRRNPGCWFECPAIALIGSVETGDRCDLLGERPLFSFRQEQNDPGSASNALVKTHHTPTV
jgi:hypothetical protein